MQFFSILIILLLPFYAGCDNFGDMKSYWVSVEKKESFMIVDETKMKELTNSSYSGNDYALPQIGWLIEYAGNPYPSGISLEAYACRRKTDNIIIGEFTNNNNKALVLINKELLKQAKVINKNEEVVDDLCLKSFYRNNHDISEDKYMVKIDKEEISKAIEELDNVSKQ